MKNIFKISAFIIASMAVSSVTAQSLKGNSKPNKKTDQAVDSKKPQQDLQEAPTQKQKGGIDKSNADNSDPRLKEKSKNSPSEGPSSKPNIKKNGEESPNSGKASPKAPADLQQQKKNSQKPIQKSKANEDKSSK
jgi:hypothetical protein